MKIPPIIGINMSHIKKTTARNLKTQNMPALPPRIPNDSVTFSSNAQYIKKYATLPKEIRAVLSPADAIDMFKDMELVAQGKVKRKRIGQGNSSDVYKTPWLEDYYFVVLSDSDITSQIIYSKAYIGDAVWQDKDNKKIQLLAAV